MASPTGGRWHRCRGANRLSVAAPAQGVGLRQRPDLLGRLRDRQEAGVSARRHTPGLNWPGDEAAIDRSRAGVDRVSVRAKRGASRPARTRPTGAGPAPSTTRSWTAPASRWRSASRRPTPTTRPSSSLGVHLTVVAEFADYRWGPLAPRDEAPSLLDETGSFFGDDRRAELLAGARLDEPRAEFRAQIGAVLAAGLRPTHLDWHCLRDGGRPDVFDLTLRLADEYGLALRVFDPTRGERLRRRGPCPPPTAG